ncbi:MAG TPA: homogentisate phytyltransferase [Candidatus Sulfomarinibacteraceae bacterium]|nr:homogentisate phytyltransferase [Candidatus Sulfomarinibacteraceae bacterium]
MKTVQTLIRFSRPHTVLATSVQVAALYIISGAINAGAPALALAWLACLAINVYVVGLNQITDVAIDRVNKPYLPLAAGVYSPRKAGAIVLVAGALALALAAWQGFFLLLTVAIAFVVGTVYSLPPLRLKQRAFWAALSIALVRGVTGNLGLYAHFRSVAGLPVVWSPLILWATLFFFGFCLVIALYKDIPDHDGDRRYTVRTFTVRFGPRRVFVLGRWLLTAFYLAPSAFFVAQLPGPAELLFLLGHLLALLSFWAVSLRVNPLDAGAVSRFYLGLWGLFYAEYLLLTLRELAGLIPV